jgi:hypothetical protein
LSFTPGYFIPSFAVMGEVQSVGVAVLAIALAEKYRRDGGWLWVLLAGGSLAFALSLKILPVYAVPLTGLMVISRRLSLAGGWPTIWESFRSSRGILLRDTLFLAGSFLIVFFLPFLFFNLAALYDQVFGMRFVSRETEFNPFESNTLDIVNFIFGNVSLTLLALAGLVFVILPNLGRYWLLLAWLILVWLSMRLHIPLRPKHLPVFLPILSLMAGLGAAYLFNALKPLNQVSLSLRTVTLVLIASAILGMGLWEAPQIIAENSGQASPPEENTARLNALDFIQTISTPEDCVIADNPVFLHSSGRLPPPELAEVSTTRIDTGYLTLADMTEALTKHRCHVVAILTPRFGESMPGLIDWLNHNYLGLYNQNNETMVYFAQKGADDYYTALPQGEFGDILKLYGVHFTEPQTGQLDRFVSLFWQLQAPLPVGYSQRLTLRPAGQSQVVYQTTRPFFAGQFDPASWKAGDRAKDTFYLALPADLPPGAYELYLSLCLPEQCLPLDGAADEVELYLGQIGVRAS